LSPCPHQSQPSESAGSRQVLVDKIKLTSTEIEGMENGTLVLNLCGFIKYTDVFDINLLSLFSGFRGSLDIQQMQYGCGGGKFHRFLVVGHCQLCGLK
jgi:hypothetical protein